ncbi:MAG TPA: response regulator [Casimicrobiaceae bacterium]|nr:response regulator [Casimicrobiaceae bacterium]
MKTIASWSLAAEHDVVDARQHARRIAERIGFERQDQVRIATAVSELARSAIHPGRPGRLEFAIDGSHAPQLLVVEISGAHVAGRAASGLDGARRLVDRSAIRNGPDGTHVTLHKLLPPKAALLDATALAALQRDLWNERRSSPLEELQQQHRDLLQALAELRERQDQLERLNRELEDTNRGVVALYAELDQKADHLRRADETKSRFLSNMSHEFRTPLNSIRALCGLLLERLDGPLTPEQEKQVTLVRKAADDLSGLVEDLLDLAKIEAGRIEVHPAEFTVDNLFSALRGMFRPLLAGDAVALRFDVPAHAPVLHTDEAKLSQILRNFVSNALKFTEAGEVVVGATFDEDGSNVTFWVRDTGIGIAPADCELVFEEFVQVKHALQRRVKGTGLGLPLCRRLAACLGGSVSLESEPGVGSTFFTTLPVRYAAAIAPEAPVTPSPPQPWRVPILIVDAQPELQRFYAATLADTAYRPVAALSLREARERLREARPAAVLLDIVLDSEDAWPWLAELNDVPEGEIVPVIITGDAPDVRKSLALGARDCLSKPIERGRLIAALDQAVGPRLLVVDDDAATRYALRRQLAASGCYVIEATDAASGLAAARDARPAAIVLDLGLPDRDGTEVLAELKDDPATRDIPVLIATTRDLSLAEEVALRDAAEVVLAKRELPERLIAALDTVLHRPGGPRP